jgi:predicted transcriptional regulator
MSTTIHVPSELLSSVDRRAKQLGLSRNRYILRALERAVEEETAWSPELRKELAAASEDPESRRALEELRAAITANRTRKPPPDL